MPSKHSVAKMHRKYHGIFEEKTHILATYTQAHSLAIDINTSDAYASNADANSLSTRALC